MEKEKLRNLSLLTLGLVLMGLFTSISGQQLVFIILVFAISFYFVIKEKENITNKDIAIAFILGGLAELHGMVIADYIQGPLILVSTAASFMAASPIFRRYIQEDKVSGAKPSVSIGLGVILGIVLGIFNVKMAGADLDFKFSGLAISSALQAGIWEEVSMRFFFYALGVYILKSDAKTTLEKVLFYILMICPHVLGHGTMDFESFAFMALFFGLPMTIVQRKVDLRSAIILHTVIDLIRFFSLGV